MDDVGKVASITTRRVGTALIGDHPAGTTALSVYDAFDFDETGGRLQAGETVLTYTTCTTTDDEQTPDTITLAAATTVALEDGVQVWFEPRSDVTTAAVILDETGEALDDVIVPQHLVPTLPDGIRLTTDATLDEEGVTDRYATAETVTIRQDEYGDWVVVSVDKGEASIDGSLINPESTIPEGALSDGLAPAASPVPMVLPFIGLLVVKWDGVANRDLTSYEVHASTDPDFTPTTDTLADETPGLLSYVRSTPGGGPLAYDTDYYVRLVAKDADGAAAPSAAVVGRASKVGLADIMAESITAEMLEAVLVLASTIKLGDLIDISVPTLDTEGKPVGGIVVRDPANPTGTPLVQLHPAGCRFKGELVTDVLTILERAVINNRLLLGPGSVTELQEGIPNPTVAPDVKTGPEAQTPWPAIPNGWVERGIRWDAGSSAWWRLIWNASTKGIAVQSINGAGEVTANVVNTRNGLDFVTDVSSLARVSNTVVLMVLEAFADGTRHWRISSYPLGTNTARAQIVTYAPQADVAGAPAIGVREGTSDLVVARLSTSNKKLLARPVNGATLSIGNQAIEVTPDYLDRNTIDLRAVQIGTFDFGAGAVLWIGGGRDHYFADFPGWPTSGSTTAANTRLDGLFYTDATISNGGAAWKPASGGPGRLLTTSADQLLTQWGTWKDDIATRYWSIRYADTDATGSTAASPITLLRIDPRRVVTVSLPPAPKGVTGASVWAGYDPVDEASTFYRRSEALSPARSMVLQGVTTSGSTAVPTQNTTAGELALIRSARQGNAYDQGWWLDAAGRHRGIAPQAGSVTAQVPGNGTVDVDVTFAVPFTAPPIVNTTVVGSVSPWLVASSPRNVTATGFTLRIGRDAATATNHTANWTATPAR